MCLQNLAKTSRLGDRLFSVVIPTYSRQELLNEALASVLNQTFDDLEVVVVDDASPDPALVPVDTRVRLIRQPENRGKSAALNVGLAAAKGEYVAFLDDDDTWTPTRLANAARAHVLADLVICGLPHAGKGRIRLREGRFGSGADAWKVSKRMLDSREILGSMGQMSIRRDLCLPFDESYRAAEDLEWSIRVTSQAGLRVVGLSAQDWNWRQHSGDRYLNGQFERIAGSERLLLEHADWYRENPRARAFRLYRLGVMSLSIGQRQQAMKYLAQSLAVRPQPRRLALAARIAMSFTKGGRREDRALM